jgi:hypothetical protein
MKFRADPAVGLCLKDRKIRCPPLRATVGYVLALLKVKDELFLVRAAVLHSARHINGRRSVQLHDSQIPRGKMK